MRYTFTIVARARWASRSAICRTSNANGNNRFFIVVDLKSSIAIRSDGDVRGATIDDVTISSSRQSFIAK